LSAGASVVIASYWAVNDFSTWLLMVDVYRHVLNNADSTAGGLQKASWALRAMTAAEAVARLDAERLVLEANRRQAEIDQNDEAYIASTIGLRGLAAERKRLMRFPVEARPFDIPYYWAAFGVHGALEGAAQISISKPVRP